MCFVFFLIFNSLCLKRSENKQNNVAIDYILKEFNCSSTVLLTHWPDTGIILGGDSERFANFSAKNSLKLA